MFDILLHGSEGWAGLTSDEFMSKLSEICDSHRADEKALAFAIILYDFGDPSIAKVLHDDDYWSALDELSGSYVSVFSFHTKHERLHPAESPGLQQRKPVSRLREANLSARDQLGPDRSFKVPAIVFFQVVDSQLAGSRAVELRATTVEESFKEIETILGVVVDSLREVVGDNRDNAPEIFALIDDGLRDMGIKALPRKLINKAKPLKAIFRLLGLNA
ncbi:MAG: hypothetical protein CEE38_17260 [Planctomycetes bacterium B3_Pla]|nr:MAG: hypothetical protein CEE38_17260 [Planctomycetes bacterium B3_Pla]